MVKKASLSAEVEHKLRAASEKGLPENQAILEDSGREWDSRRGRRKGGRFLTMFEPLVSEGRSTHNFSVTP